MTQNNSVLIKNKKQKKNIKKQSQISKNINNKYMIT